MRHLLQLAAVTIALASLMTAHAQQPPPTLRADIASLTEGTYPDVSAVINLDDSGAAVGALSTANFTATVNGKPAPVIGTKLAASENLPLDVVIVIDVSGSMAGEAIVQTKAAANGFIAGLAPTDRVALITFSDDVHLIHDYTTDRGVSRAAIDALVAAGNTALYKATSAAAIKAASSPSTRRAVILLSDGAQDGVPLTTTRAQAIAAAAGVGVPFFAIAEGKDIDRGYLTELGTSTKGRELEAPNPTQLTALYESVGKLLRSQYIVTFDGSAAAGLPQAPVSIQLRADTRTATGTASFKPSANFVAPSITVSGIQAGEAIDASRVVTVQATSDAPLSHVAFSVDGVNVFEAAAAPFTFTYEPKAYGAGSHSLTVSAQAGSQSIASPPLVFTSTPPVIVKPSGGTKLPIIPILAAVGAIVLIAAIVAFVLKQRRRPRVHVVPPDQRTTPWAQEHRSLTPIDAAPEPIAPPAPEVVVEPRGVLVLRSGAGVGTEYAIGARPVSVGSDAICAVRILDADFSAVEARVWVRDSHLMVHKITRLSSVANDGPAGGWVILETGDTFAIGDHQFEFRVVEERAAQPAEDAPNVLRDADASRRVPTPDSPPPARVPRMTDLMTQPDAGFGTPSDS